MILTKCLRLAGNVTVVRWFDVASIIEGAEIHNFTFGCPTVFVSQCEVTVGLVVWIQLPLDSPTTFAPRNSVRLMIGALAVLRRVLETFHTGLVGGTLQPWSVVLHPPVPRLVTVEFAMLQKTHLPSPAAIQLLKLLLMDRLVDMVAFQRRAIIPLHYPRRYVPRVIAIGATARRFVRTRRWLLDDIVPVGVHSTQRIVQERHVEAGWRCLSDRISAHPPSKRRAAES